MTGQDSDDEAKVPKVENFSGKAKHWPKFKKAVNAKALAYSSQNYMDIIVDAGECVNETLQKLRVSDETKSFTFDVRQYSDIMWKTAMETAQGGDIIVRMRAARDRHLSKAMGKAWNDKDSATHGGEYLKRKAVHIVSFLRIVNALFIRMLVQACIPKVKCTSEQESLKSILDTQEIEEVLNGRKYKQKWVREPWKMPAVQVWARMLDKYEGLQDSINSNILWELLAILANVKDRSIKDIDTSFHKAFQPIVRNFDTARQLADYLRACVRDEVIHRKARIKGPEQRSFELARDWNTRRLHDGVTI